ncbi:MAG: bifunctional deaminase-reductase domain protein [Cellvibrio sp.]|jgi:dihydrofolate reductase|nr:bifunctional deaminase-reductase domain protein [Cellvibrio sp.]
MKTQYYTAASLDGFIATEDHSIDWLFPLADINQSSYPEFIEHIGAIAMGSGTYEWLLCNADAVKAEMGTPWPYTQPVWVFSHRALPAVDSANIHYVQGDVREQHALMCAAAAGKHIWITGGGELAAQFYDAGLLDEMIIQIGSVTLGKGKQVFPRQVFSPALKLQSAQQMGEGMVELRYSVQSKR